MKRPNVLFILSDDQGAWAMGCAGNRELKTPNIDRIAEMGMRFDSFFCVSPVCSPARASLLTGTIPSAHGVHDWIRSGNVDAERFAQQGAENPYDGYTDESRPIQYLQGMTTYTDLMCREGYHCALSGKWHLGDSINPQHGFQTWSTLGKGGCFYYHPDVAENDDIFVRHGTYVTDHITERALGFLDRLAREDAPFYLSVHYTAPHAPWGAEHHPKEYIDLYEDCPFESTPDLPDHPDSVTGKVYGTPARRENLRGYYAAITAMDDGIGRLLDSLEEKGILQDTIVIFTSDNGMSMGHHGIWGKGNGTFPFNLYDTAIKVPFLIAYPRLIAPGSLCSRLTSAYDLFPTFLELLNLNGQETARLPGKSFASALAGKTGGGSPVVVYDEYGPARMIRTEKYKFIQFYPYGKGELYDLEKDPEEKENCIDRPDCTEISLTLRSEMEEWFCRYADPARTGTQEGVTGLGQLSMAGLYARQMKKYATTEAM